ncbi:hypothetical protein TRFO_37848 [Tritrichomonas foetus]|uniref:Uncharacterized protein n=1 Tax=Tritrichomonas foetus TaxID=1144522 RepID=A0A1J4JBD8_9EUKA|nr:hypothetical protein TRFO_37848 [Tritrichomonas foetus]|eukprot:OHS95985.1 hypothetical protein TRFO_37848 [Tritrichomonas foetus]
MNINSIQFLNKIQYQYKNSSHNKILYAYKNLCKHKIDNIQISFLKKIWKDEKKVLNNLIAKFSKYNSKKYKTFHSS